MGGGETLEMTSPGRTAECGKSEDRAARSGNTVHAGRFQRMFVSGVALLLGLTGGVKLLGVLQEARVLGAADPLFPFLTMRQVLFLAAGLELGVAYTLWRHRSAVWSPWLVLWLAGLFTGYRFSLWFIGFRGHCSCLGHLFDWPAGVQCLGRPGDAGLAGHDGHGEPVVHLDNAGIVTLALVVGDKKSI